MATLYRKYRPQTFADLVGQLHVRTTLLAELSGDVVAHAFLFVGPRGVGKTTTARLLAKAVNCLKPKNGEPDNTCQSCVAINEGRSLDLIEIDAASHTQVDHVREHILPAARTAPSIGRFKVFIIDEVHMLSISAFNALLKVIEEPPAHVIFILATTEAHRLPATIISRCQRFDFRRVGLEDTVKRLTHVLEEEGVRADRAVLERISRLSQGSLRDAESMLGQLVGLGEKHLTVDLADVVLPRSDVQSALTLFEQIVHRQAGPALEFIQRLVDDGIQVGTFMRECIDVGRALLLISLGVERDDAYLAGQDEARAQAIVALTTPRFLEQTIDTFVRRERDERYSSLPQLPLELAVVELITSSDDRVPPPSRKQNFQARHDKSIAPVEETPRSTSKSVTEVSAKWSQLVSLISKTNHSLALLLKGASPHGIVNGALKVAVPYAFHRDRIVEPKSAAVLSAAVRETYGTDAKIEVEVAPQSSVAGADDVWQQALQSFGGKLSEKGGFDA